MSSGRSWRLPCLRPPVPASRCHPPPHLWVERRPDNVPGAVTKHGWESSDEVSAKLAREYAGQFDDGNSAFDGGSLRADDTDEYDTHINPERRD